MSRILVYCLAACLMLLLFSCGQTVEKTPGTEAVAVDSASKELAELNNAILRDSANADLYYRRALYFLDGKEINQSLSDIGKAIGLDDQKADYFVTLADLYLAMGKIPACLDALKKAETLDPLHNDALLKLAEVYLILRDYPATFSYTRKALDQDLINPVAYFIRGYAYIEQGDTTLAIKSFQAAADQDQQYYEAFVELGILYSALRDPVATGYLETATRIRPNRPEAYYLLGMAYQEQEIIPKAMDTYHKLTVVDPGYKEAWYNLGYLSLVYVHEFEQAIAFFNKALEIDPKYTDAYFNRGYSFELSGNMENARRDYQKALEITPNYERAVLGLNRLDSLLQ